MGYLQDLKRAERLRTDLLNFCISKDETRLHLTGVVHHGQVESLVSCDGYKAAILPSRYNDSIKDIIIEPKTYRVIEREYPKLGNLVPDISTLETSEFYIKTNHYIKEAKGKPTHAYFHVNDKGSYVSLEESEGHKFVINASFLKYLVGKSWHIAYGKGLSPILVSLDGDSFTDQFLMMPLKV